MKKIRQECRCWENQASDRISKEAEMLRKKPIQNRRFHRSLHDWDDQDWTREMYRDVYDPEKREADLENDELASWEVAFMEGYDIAA